MTEKIDLSQILPKGIENISPEKLEIDEQGRTILARCDKCGEVTDYRQDGYEYAVDCRCMRTYRKKKRLEKFAKLSIVDRDSGTNTFGNAVLNTSEEKSLYKKMQDYCNKFEIALANNVGILLHSVETGTGKTYLANCICNELKNKGYAVLSFNVSGYLNTIRNNSQAEEEFKKALKEADLVFIDDLGSENINRKDGSLWAEEKLFNLFDERYREKKPLLITTNLDEDGLMKHLKMNGTDKIFFRLCEMCKSFEMKFKNKRLNRDFILF